MNTSAGEDGNVELPVDVWERLGHATHVKKRILDGHVVLLAAQAAVLIGRLPRKPVSSAFLGHITRGIHGV